MKISKYIKDLRKNLKLTQNEFAVKVGVSRSNIAKYETDKPWGTVPPGDVLINIQSLDRIKIIK